MSNAFFDHEGRTVNQFGTPVTHPMAQPMPQPMGQPAYGQPMGQPAYGVYGPPQRRGLSPGAKVAVWVGGSLGALVALAIVAAVVLPLYLDHRARVEAAHITVSLPDTLNGLNRNSNVSGSAIESAIAGLPRDLSSSTYGAVYGDGRSAVVTVLAGQHLMLPRDQRDYLNGFSNFIKKSGLQVDAAPVRDGDMVCVAHTAVHASECAFADAGSFGLITVVSPTTYTTEQIKQVRDQIETRH